MTALYFLFVLLLVTTLALGWSAGRSMRRRRVLERLAQGWSLQFSALDRFDLARRVVGNLPGVGADVVRVYDVMYCRRTGCYHYIFTVGFAQDATVLRHYRTLVARVTEPQETGADQLEVVLASSRGAKGYQQLLPAR